METKEISFNLAQVANSLANQPRSGILLRSGITEVEALKSLEPDEMAALKAFLSENHSLASLLSNPDNPPIENDWWSS